MDKDYKEIVDDCLDEVSSRHPEKDATEETTELRLEDHALLPRKKKKSSRRPLYVVVGILCLCNILLIGVSKDLPRGMSLEESRQELQRVYGDEDFTVVAEDFMSSELSSGDTKSLEILTEKLNKALESEPDAASDGSFQSEYFLFFGDTLLYREP